MSLPTAQVRSVLYVRLPVWKIWPGGVVYLADYIHKQRPHIHQEILDLAVIPADQRKTALIARLLALKPDVVAFSWRNMQTFGPHPENDALDVVMNFDHSPSPWKRLKAAWQATGIIIDYALQRASNFGYLKLIRRLLPQSRLVVGGTAVSIFGKYIAQRCPNDTIVVVGEGEEAMLAIVDGFTKPAGNYYHKDSLGQVHHHPAEDNFHLPQLSAVDFSYIASIFPAFGDYVGPGKDPIGVHTKRGCPFQCQFCLYNKIEGPRQRYREPVEVAKEIETLSKVYGVERIWFTDAQFCSTRRSMEHVEAILDEMMERQINVRWTGYLRLNYLNAEIAKKMLASGLESIDLSFTGSQDMIDSLTLGYALDQQMAAFRLFQNAGMSDQKIKLYLPLNAPDESIETLLATIDRVNELYEMFGRDKVLPFIFFVGVQPNTPIEQKLIESGYLQKITTH